VEVSKIEAVIMIYRMNENVILFQDNVSTTFFHNLLSRKLKSKFSANGVDQAKVKFHWSWWWWYIDWNYRRKFVI